MALVRRRRCSDLAQDANEKILDLNFNMRPHTWGRCNHKLTNVFLRNEGGLMCHY